MFKEDSMCRFLIVCLYIASVLPLAILLSKRGEFRCP